MEKATLKEIEVKDKYGSKINFERYTTKGNDSRVQIYLTSTEDYVNDYMDDNDVRVDLSEFELQEFIKKIKGEY